MKLVMLLLMSDVIPSEIFLLELPILGERNWVTAGINILEAGSCEEN
jgi:hypothetical protein